METAPVKKNQRKSDAVAYRMYGFGGNDGESYDYKEYYQARSIDPAEMEHPMDDPEEDPRLNSDDPLEKELAEEEEAVRNGWLVTDENRYYISGWESTVESNTRKPKLITSEEFDNGYPQYDKRQLEFYVYDQCLVDMESNEQIFDEEKVVGDCLDKFGFRNPENEEDVIFVRNFSFMADYEISKLYAAFSEHMF